MLCIGPRHPLGPRGKTFGGSVSDRRDGHQHRQGYQGRAKAGEPLAKDAIHGLRQSILQVIRNPRAAATPPKRTLSPSWLESWFLPPFERVAREGCGTFMLGYGNPSKACRSHSTSGCPDKLRGAWNYQGTLITDWDNVGRSVWERESQAGLHAAADASKAGNDLV